jgi:hypothetical protein
MSPKDPALPPVLTIRRTIATRTLSSIGHACIGRACIGHALMVTGELICEAVTRHAVGSGGRVVRQSTSQGLRLYERMGFRAVTRILAYNSVR